MNINNHKKYSPVRPKNMAFVAEFYGLRLYGKIGKWGNLRYGRTEKSPVRRPLHKSLFINDRHIFVTNSLDPHPSPYLATICCERHLLAYPHPLKKITSFVNGP